MPFTPRFQYARTAETLDADGNPTTIIFGQVAGTRRVSSTVTTIIYSSGAAIDVQATEDEIWEVIEPTPGYVPPHVPPPDMDLTGGLLRIEPTGGGIAYQLAGENRLGDWALMQQNGPEIVVHYLWNDLNGDIRFWPYLGVVK